MEKSPLFEKRIQCVHGKEVCVLQCGVSFPRPLRPRPLRPRPLRALQKKGVLREETYIYKYVHTNVVCLVEERSRPFWFQKSRLGKEKYLSRKEKSLSEKHSYIKMSLSEKEPCAIRAFLEKKPCRNRYLLEKEPCEDRSHFGKRSL